MKFRQNVLAGLVEFKTMEPGDVFRCNGEFWLAIQHLHDRNVVLLKNGGASHFEDDRLVHPIDGQFVEEGAE